MTKKENVLNFPLGICQCGCGQPTGFAKSTNMKTGRVKGGVLLYLQHHNSRWASRPRAVNMKWCGRCKKLLPLSAFSRQVSESSSYSARCASCNGRVCKEQRESSPENIARSKRYNRNGLLRRHGITQADYDRLYAEQKGLCAICDKPEKGKNPDGSPRLLFIDHDHLQKFVRQLLCHYCNAGLGCFFDNPFRLKKAMDYLIRHQAILLPQPKVQLG